MKAILVLLAALAFGIAPFVTDGFAGFRPDQFPIPQDNAPVQPAGYAFSIWGVIYLWLLVYAVIGVWRHRADLVWGEAAWPMVVSMGIGSIWIKAATISVLWATVLIWAMLVSALIGLYRARNAEPIWAIGLPIGLYAGWLSAASLVSLGLIGAGYGLWFSPSHWAVAMIACAILLGGVICAVTPRVWSYPLALTWALVAIGISNLDGSRLVAFTAFLAAAIFLVRTAWSGILDARGETA